jgi:cytochrome c oxidase subunit 3
MLALPPSAAPTRPRTLLVGVGVAIAACTVLLGSMLATYLNVRDEVGGGTTGAWLNKTVVPEVAANMMLIIVFGASVLVQWAVYAIARGDRRHTGYALGLTALFGLAAINTQSYIWRTVKLGLAKGAYQTMFYVVTGTFVMFLVAGIIVAIVTAFRSLGGRYSATDTDGVAAAALFWHFLSVATCAVWYVMYVVK